MMKKCKKVHERGRSMVEMLGVLAIIGVLSIGGIAGYTLAMNKYRTNELVNAAFQRANTVAIQMASGRTPSMAEFENMKVSAGTFDNTIIKLDNELAGKFAIKVTGVNDSVCKNMIQLATEGNAIKMITKDYDIDASLLETDCSGSNNSFFIIFNNDLSI